jgi:hypothetical protein
MTAHDPTTANRAARETTLFVVLGATFVLTVPGLTAISTARPVAVAAVIAWLGLVTVGLCVGASFPTGVLASLRGRGPVWVHRSRHDRRTAMVAAMLLLAVSMSLVSQQNWGNWYSLLLVAFALAGGRKVAQVAPARSDLGPRSHSWHPEMGD